MIKIYYEIEAKCDCGMTLSICENPNYMQCKNDHCDNNDKYLRPCEQLAPVKED